MNEIDAAEREYRLLGLSERQALELGHLCVTAGYHPGAAVELVRAEVVNEWMARGTAAIQGIDTALEHAASAARDLDQGLEPLRRARKASRARSMHKPTGMPWDRRPGR